MAQNEIIKLLQSYIALLNKAGLRIQKAFLFGSYARNEGGDESDIDIMLVSESFDNNNIEEKAKAWQLTRKVDVRIEPFTIGLKKFISEDDSALLAVVRKEGIEIAI